MGVLFAPFFSSLSKSALCRRGCLASSRGCVPSPRAWALPVRLEIVRFPMPCGSRSVEKNVSLNRRSAAGGASPLSGGVSPYPVHGRYLLLLWIVRFSVPSASWRAVLLFALCWALALLAPRTPNPRFLPKLKKRRSPFYIYPRRSLFVAHSIAAKGGLRNMRKPPQKKWFLVSSPH